MNWFRLNIDQVQGLTRLTYLYMSNCPLLNLVFHTFLCSLLKYWLEIWYMNLLWHNTDQVWVSLSLTIFLHELLSFAKISFSGLSSAVFWDIYLKFGLWIGIDIIQIKFEFHHAWPAFTGVIALCKNLVFRTFLCSLLRYWLEIWYMNWFRLNIDQVQGLSRLTYLYMSKCPLLNLVFQTFLCSLLKYWLEIWYINWF